MAQKLGAGHYPALSAYLPSDVSPSVCLGLTPDITAIIPAVDAKTTTPEEAERFSSYADRTIATLTAAVERYVDALHDLESRLLAAMASDQPGADPERSGRTGKSRTKSAADGGAAAGLDNLAIGRAADGTWHRFKKFGRSWRHQGPMNPQPNNRQEKNLLDSFLESGGQLTPEQLVRAIVSRAVKSDIARLVENRGQAAISRLRRYLGKSLGLQDPSRAIECFQPLSYRLNIEIGVASDQDDGGLCFLPAGSDTA